MGALGGGKHSLFFVLLVKKLCVWAAVMQSTGQICGSSNLQLLSTETLTVIRNVWMFHPSAFIKGNLY